MPIHMNATGTARYQGMPVVCTPRRASVILACRAHSRALDRPVKSRRVSRMKTEAQQQKILAGHALADLVAEVMGDSPMMVH